MLAATRQLKPTRGSPLMPAVLRLAVVLLYTAGLRRGELLRLSLQDVDVNAEVQRTTSPSSASRASCRSRPMPGANCAEGGANASGNSPEVVAAEHTLFEFSSRRCCLNASENVKREE